MIADADIAAGKPFSSIAMSPSAATANLMKIEQARLRVELRTWDRTVASRDAMIAVLRFASPAAPKRKGLSLGGIFASRGVDVDAGTMPGQLLASGLFLPAWYAHTQALTLGEAPAHFVKVGMEKGLAPNPFFDPQWYQRTYLVDQTEPAIRHYMRIGARYALTPGPLFDPLAYMVRYPTIANVPDLLSEFLLRGLADGHVATPLAAAEE